MDVIFRNVCSLQIFRDRITITTGQKRKIQGGSSYWSWNGSEKKEGNLLRYLVCTVLMILAFDLVYSLCAYIRELRLIEAMDGICEKIMEYNIHKERKGSLRFAKVSSLFLLFVPTTVCFQSNF